MLNNLKYRFKLALIVVISLFFNRISGQPDQIRFENLSNQVGFRNSAITSIFQDSKGFIWIGSYSGLARYDGHSFTYFNYEPSDANSLSDSKISCITEDIHGSLWVGTQYGLNRMNPKTQSFERYFFGDQGHSRINTLYSEKNGDVWVGTSKGLWKYRQGADELEKFEVENLPDDFHETWTGPVIRDHSQILWIGSPSGLYRWDDRNLKLQLFKHNPEDRNSLSHNVVHALENDHLGRLWIGTMNGLNLYKENENHFRQYPFPDSLYGKEGPRIRNIVRTLDQKLLLGTSFELLVINPIDESFTIKAHSVLPFNMREYKDISLYTIYEDWTGNIWVGTGALGLYKYSPTTLRFKNYFSNPIADVSEVIFAREMYEFEEGELLLWRKNIGLQQFNYHTGLSKPYPFKPKDYLEEWNSGVTCIIKDQNRNIWFGTAHGGIFKYNSTQSLFEHYSAHQNKSNGLSGNSIRDLLEDKEGNIWVATMGSGVSRFNPKKNSWKRYLKAQEYPGKKYSITRKIYEDRSGIIWVGTRGGLHRFNASTSSFKHYEHILGDPKSISESTVFDMYEDSLGNFWVGTYGGGLNLFDREKETFKYFTTKDGLSDNTIFSILPDRKENLWLSTFNGLVYFDQHNETFTTYGKGDGLANVVFNAFSYYKSPYSGHIFLEGVDGMDIFHPDSIFTDTTLPSISFTNFKLSNREVPIRNEGSAQDSINKYYLPGHISTLEKVVLPHHQKVITFEFAALHFANPKKNQYAYKLEGFDEDWQEIGKNNAATFTNLDPGSYTLRVKASNGDGIWNEEGISMALIITPPWWETWWAYGLYLLLLSLLLIAIYRYQRKRWQLQTALRLEQQEAGKLKELDILKTNLYTNITHEFRTPLTVVLGLSKIVQEKLATLSATKIIDHLQTIDRNSRSLLKLVNQMLDLSKIEAGKLQVNYIQSDIIPYLNRIVDSLAHYAKSNNIEIHVLHEFATHHMDFDPEKLEQIINNILSNAIKFTPAGGHIYLLTNVQEKIAQFHIKIKDTGLGIPAEEIPHIFNRFYQIEQSSTRKGEGTGIGLALTKELLSLMQGQILVQSKPSEGSIFEIILPISRVASIHTTTALPSVTSNPLQAEARSRIPLVKSHEEVHLSKASKPLVLLVEDNIDVRFYVREILIDQFQIEEAQDGQEGIDKAIEKIPDLIITDIMMPKKDGLELCMTLKEDERTSHIPIVMLTAKADLDSRLAGLSTGANAYLSKPFSREELLLKLNNLLTWGKKLKERYQGITPDSSITVANAALEIEDAFVKKVREAIESHLSDVEFSAEELAKQVYLSRTQVHRKLKALTGKSTGQFIHTVRLHHALKLLKETDMSITQIAYEAGYKEVSYFSRLFAEEFGKTASLIRKQL